MRVGPPHARPRCRHSRGTPPAEGTTYRPAAAKFSGGASDEQHTFPGGRGQPRQLLHRLAPCALGWALLLRSSPGGDMDILPAQLVEPEAVSQSHAARFHRQVFDEVQVADAQEVADLLGPARDTRGFTQRLRRSSQVIALKHANTFVYPRFQFDFDRHTVRPVVAQVNQRLRASTDPWGALAWWLAEQPRWGRRRPVGDPDDTSLVDLVEADADDGF
ncbi:MAG: hypothetical protein ACYDH5_13070 [Acidimicrobiales bacterium]